VGSEGKTIEDRDYFYK
jgi:hypothetical protein